jgi:hypothetical protein
LVVYWGNPQLNNIAAMEKVMFFHSDKFLVDIWSARAISLRLSSNQVIRHHLRMNYIQNRPAKKPDNAR